jgi:hypothetical protein
VSVAQRLVLHIGSMKSGTSFIQNVLGHNKEHLGDAGILFPGQRWRSQVNAVKELIGRGGPKQEPFDPDGAWQRLADEINAWSGTAVVSMEFLGPRSAEKIGQILDSFPDTHVEAVLTCRDLARNIPAMWLESVQNGSVTTWTDYLAAVRDRDTRSPAGRNFWRHQDLVEIAGRWGGALGPDRLTLLTVPQRGAPPGLLWERFAGVLGIDPEGCDLEVRANPGIGLATGLVLRRLNEQMVQDGEIPDHYDRFVKHALSKRGLVARQGVEPRLGLDEPWVLEEGERQVRALADQGHRVVGDLDELMPRPVAGVQPAEVSLEEQLDAAVDGLAHLVSSWADADRQQNKKIRRLKQKAGGAGDR